MILEDCEIKYPMPFLFKDFLLDTCSTSPDYRIEHDRRFIAFIHLFNHVPGTRLENDNKRMQKTWPQGVEILIGEIKIHCDTTATGQYKKHMPNVIKEDWI